MSGRRKGASTARRILVIEDDPDIRELIVEALTLEGYTAHGGEDGQGLGMALALPPDLILLDLSMHPMDGWEVRRHLLGYETTRAIPVILVTAANQARQWQQDLRCAGLVAKPFRLEQLIGEVARVLAEKEAEDESS